MKLEGLVTDVFVKNYDALQTDKRFIVNQGGSRSSKTWSIAQLFLKLLFTEKNCLLTVCRKTLPALRASAMRDFFGIMVDAGVYRVENHNKTELTYTYKTNEIEFISIDQPQKVRGRKRRHLWMNEANEFTYEDFRQLNIRTEEKIFMDYNPSDEFHWIYDNILTRDDRVFIKSTYKDNPFLEKSIVKEIELLKQTDPNYWRIYGLGERGISETTIFIYWQLAENWPEFDEVIYGVDFGFNNPTALVKVGIKDKENYLEELLYESHLTNSQLIDKLKLLELGDAYIYADAAEPQRIEEIKRAGFNIYPADKDVKKGIDEIRTHKLFINKNSVNLLKEIKSYKWKVKDDKPLDEPVKMNDHLLDAARYAVHTHSLVEEPDIHFI